MNIRTVSVTFPYSLKCVPKGCRTERKLLVRGRTTAAIRTAASDDVTKAFRVYFPTENPLRFVRPNKMTGDAYRRKAPTIDIVRCEGMVWWPWRAEDGNSAYDVGELADFIDRLEDGSDDLLTMLPAGSSWWDVQDRPALRSVADDRCDAATALVHRKERGDAGSGARGVPTVLSPGRDRIDVVKQPIAAARPLHFEDR